MLKLKGSYEAVLTHINRDKRTSLCFHFDWCVPHLKDHENNKEMHGCFISKLFLLKETLIKPLGWCSLWPVSSKQGFYFIKFIIKAKL